MSKNTNFSANDEKNIPINMLQGSEITKNQNDKTQKQHQSSNSIYQTVFWRKKLTAKSRSYFPPKIFFYPFCVQNGESPIWEETKTLID